EASVARKAGRRVAGDTIDGEERVRVRLPCPRHVRARWGQVQVLARCVCGSELAPWHAAEAIAAEGLSARGVEPDDPLAGLPEPPPRPLPEDEGRDVLPALDWAAVQEALPDDVEALARGAEDLNAFALDRRMRAVLRAMHRIDFQLGRLLHLLFARRLHRLLGFSSAARYAEERLGLSARKARALVALERQSAPLPALAAAYRQGQVSWLRASSLLPVVDAGSAAAWVARAGRHPPPPRRRGRVDARRSRRGRRGFGPAVPRRPARAARAANVCARGRRRHHVLRPHLGRHPPPQRRRQLHAPRRAGLAGP